MYEPSLSTEVQFLKGVGPKPAAVMNKAGLVTVEDVLYRLPRRYEDRSSIPLISTLRVGHFATIRGRIRRIDSKPLRGGQVIVRAIVNDGSGSIVLTWFNQPWTKAQLEKSGGDIFAYGQVKDGTSSHEIASPEWEAASDEEAAEWFGKIVPVYPLVEGLSQKTMRRAARSAVAGYLRLVVDPLPKSVREQQGLADLQWAIRQIHQPDDEASRLEARRRLVFEDFFYMQLALAMKRAATQHEIGIPFPVQALLKGQDPGPPLDLPPGTLFTKEERAARAQEPLWDQIHRLLPFALTGAQKRVIQEIWKDMESPHPMNRLVQGDVGSGKTAVAACALLTAVRSGYQASLMAPTEILAEQHYTNLKALLEPVGVRVAMLIGKQGSRERKQASQAVEMGTAEVVVGTHALVQESVKFRRLGLVIVDEQHRFGVLQRKALRDKGFGNPDVLVMTATPIPRTLTMTVYGDLDLSVIDELPPGRKPVKTHWKRSSERMQVYQSVRGLIEEGKQAYFVCPMVSESEKMMAQAAEDLHYRLSNGPLQGLRVGLLHGQMKPREKEEAMLAFRNHQFDALVSTTVIEVGVDVPNASVMVIEDANRFGLSQLHQLRGRVGRGSQQSYCILIADAKMGDARARMDVMVATNDGFRIAEEDLRLRGPGLMAGTAQSGHADFKVGDLLTDGKMLEVARQVAIEVVQKDPKLSGPEWKRVLENVRKARSEAGIITVS
ncbi:MAG TPA: ATP-dependent DNA helicase RecG [Fimbriimonas sp.]|nr:ATP-dependent DNA helicase RecG [Fimbriimonas sp.]